MNRSKEQVVKDVEKDVKRISKEAFVKAMSTEFSTGDGTQTPEEYAKQHLEKMSNVFATEMSKIVDIIYSNINDYTLGEGIDGVA